MKETRPTEPVLRDPVQIQRAHDLLTSLVLNDELFQHIIENENERLHILAAMDALCWVLGHHQNKVFAENIDYLEAAMAVEGYALKDAGQLICPDDKPPEAA